jgi:integrase
MLAYMGIRREELINITVSDINLNNQLIRIVGKGQKERPVPITHDLRIDIKEHLNGRKRGYLFQAKKKKGAPLEIGRINSICKDIGIAAKVKNPNPKSNNIHPHLLRHTFSHLCLDKGMDWPTLRDILGHSSITITLDLYGSSPIEKIKKNYAKVMAFA